MKSSRPRERKDSVDAPTPASGDTLSRVLADLDASTHGADVRSVVAELVGTVLAASDSLAGATDHVGVALGALRAVSRIHGSLTVIEGEWTGCCADLIQERDEADDSVPRDKKGRSARVEIALASRISPHRASRAIDRARHTTVHLPDLMDAVRDGAVTGDQFDQIARELHDRSPETCARVDEQLAADPGILAGKPPVQARLEVAALAYHVEPDDSATRAERAARSRCVTMTPIGDGMCTISAHLRAVDASAVMATLDAEVRALKNAGSGQQVVTLRADVFVRALTTCSVAQEVLSPAEFVDGEAGQRDLPEEAIQAVPEGGGRRPAPRIDVGVVITDHALFGDRDTGESARVEGVGLVPAVAITDLLRGENTEPWGGILHEDLETAMVFRRLYAHPESGELIAMESRARTFPVGLRRMVRFTNDTCATPWCNARVAHVDHVHPHAEGGATSFANAQGLCAGCNYAKEIGSWKVHRERDPVTGRLLTCWSSPSGATGHRPASRLGPRLS
jgi:hypothetical protein